VTTPARPAGPPRRDPVRRIPRGARLVLVEERDPGWLLSWSAEYFLAREGDTWTVWVRFPDSALLERALPGWTTERLGEVATRARGEAGAARALARQVVARRVLEELAAASREAPGDAPRFSARGPLTEASVRALVAREVQRVRGVGA
jgi:hypothetical protein